MGSARCVPASAVRSDRRPSRSGVQVGCRCGGLPPHAPVAVVRNAGGRWYPFCPFFLRELSSSSWRLLGVPCGWHRLSQPLPLCSADGRRRRACIPRHPLPFTRALELCSFWSARVDLSFFSKPRLHQGVSLPLSPPPPPPLPASRRARPPHHVVARHAWSGDGIGGGRGGAAARGERDWRGRCQCGRLCHGRHHRGWAAAGGRGGGGGVWAGGAGCGGPAARCRWRWRRRRRCPQCRGRGQGADRGGGATGGSGEGGAGRP